MATSKCLCDIERLISKLLFILSWESVLQNQGWLELQCFTIWKFYIVGLPIGVISMYSTWYVTSSSDDIS